MLKLFIWTSFNPDYSSDLAFAIAKDETDARKQIRKQLDMEPGNWGTLEIHPLNKRIARAVSGGG